MIKELLVHDLDKSKFADMYAQTLVYGLFAARYNDMSPISPLAPRPANLYHRVIRFCGSFSTTSLAPTSTGD